MATNDYIPSDDAGLDSFADDFGDYVADNNEALGIADADKNLVQSAQANFHSKMTALSAAQTAAQVARADKDASRVALVALLRQQARQIQANPATTDAQRAALGITVRDTTPTAVAAPTTQPVLFVDTSNRLMHVVSFRDALTPFSKAKPAGVSGCEIFRKIGGTPPASIAECEFVANDSASPYVADYDGADGGKMVYYFGRWATRSGLTGPTSDLISATIVA